jgi:hypothetical protein
MYRALYFLLGAVFAAAIFSFLYLWHPPKELSQVPSQAEIAISKSELAGVWHGRDTEHVTYTITRHNDGTFAEVTDSSHSLYRRLPYHVRSKGRWSLRDSDYAIFYTESSDPNGAGRGPFITTIKRVSPTEIEFSFDEGIWNTEHKE